MADSGEREAPAGTDSAPHRKSLIDDARAQRLDDLAATWLGRLTGGLPVPRIALAYMDWAINLMFSPGRQMQVAERALRAWRTLTASALGTTPPVGDDRRFAAPAWQRKPFSWFAQASLEREAVLNLATAPLPGMARHDAALVQFYTAQLLTALSPANSPFTNPEVLATTRAQRGANLLRGARHLFEDELAALRKERPGSDEFRVGRNLAVTPGKVIHRNGLMELIQYTPTTPTTFPEPILIVPAWIMKYYILDLSAENSLVRWLVAQGHTVFMISWKNPDAGDANLDMDDYRRLGILAAMDAIRAVRPRHKVHAVGYCVGGTLLAVTMAAMARDGDTRIKTATLLAAQTDFMDAGELKLFIDEMALYWLDRQMAAKGYLDTNQMGNAFGMLRSQSLVWSRIMHEYWQGERAGGIDMMAWNADGTRMPHRMHSNYLRDFYLENRLSQGKYQVDGKAVSMANVSLPMFVIGTTTDHVAPWKSVYKIRNLKQRGSTTFALTNGGHNAGIVSQPGRPRRHYQLGSWDVRTPYRSPEEWAASAETHEGSWWPAWQAWLAKHSGKPVAPPASGNPGKGYAAIDDAPGTYVLQV